MTRPYPESARPQRGWNAVEQLVKKAQSGDKDAFLVLMEENKLALSRAAMAILHNEEDVADAVAETVYKAFYKLKDLRQPKYFKTWMTRILIRNCYDLLHSRNGLVSEDLAPETGYEEERETSLDVRASMAELGENDRLVLTLYYLNDIAVKDIAKLLSISESAVKARLVHGRKKFRQVYEHRETGEGLTHA